MSTRSRVRTRQVDDENSELGIEIVIGRGLWWHTIKHLLTKTINVLLQHRWTILSPPEGLSWFTSDNPVIRLNWHSPEKYDFGGGWGNPGSEILLPLSPKHLLYTKVGEKKTPKRGTIMPHFQAKLICKYIAEHAHRMIFASEPIEYVQTIRPRIVDKEIIENERQQWKRWHDEQTAAELALFK